VQWQDGSVQISKNRQFGADGIFKAELNEFLTQKLVEDGYSGVEVQVKPTRKEIIILATRTRMFLVRRVVVGFGN
jgi:small subunit ribosomal protein S3e